MKLEDFNTAIIVAKNRNRICMYAGCKESAIKSHVLQKNGILREISENNHLIQLQTPNMFEIEKKGMFDFKLVGVNDVYTFKGFCNKHDTEIFNPIENGNTLDLENPIHQALFSYRGLCQEIRRKEISSEWITEMLKAMTGDMRSYFSSLNEGYITGMKNLSFFKEELEQALENNDLSRFCFSTVKIPKIDLCISVPLNIGDRGNPDNLSYEDWKETLTIPFATSFINIFPYKGNSYFIAGYHKKFSCKWTINKINKLRYLKPKLINKELSDLIVLRLEFWAMSPKLFKKISKTTLAKYKETFSNNVFSHSEKLRTKINLFEIM